MRRASNFKRKPREESESDLELPSDDNPEQLGTNYDEESGDEQKCSDDQQDCSQHLTLSELQWREGLE